MTPKELLRSWLERQLDPAALAWLDEATEKAAKEAGDKPLYLALGLAPRKLGKGDLTLGPEDLNDARSARADWDPRGWSVDQAARILLLLATGERQPERFPELLDQLCRTGDLGELVAFYRGLPLYSAQDKLVARAQEGARSNMRALFEAVAHRNPFPKEKFSEDAWNHLVLKALFVGSALHPIQGLDARANRHLARMMVDFAQERWAAGRDVSPELWRCVVPFADAELEKDLARALELGERGGAAGAALALSQRGDAAAERLLERAPDLAGKARRGALSWDALATA